MKIRIAILAACASTLALALAATTDTFAKDEKTFLDGNASVGKAKEGKKAGGRLGNQNGVLSDMTTRKKRDPQTGGGLFNTLILGVEPDVGARRNKGRTE
jgi:hypothetical protein